MKQFVLFIIRFATPLFFTYLVVCLVPLVFIRTEFNAPFAIAFKYLSIPVVAICLFIGLRYKSEFLARSRNRVSYWLVLILLPPLFVLMSGGLVSAANAFLAPQKTVVIQGRVQSKWVSGGRYKSLVVDLTTAEGQRRLEVSRAEYESADVGETFQVDRWMGPLGFVYTWKR